MSPRVREDSMHPRLQLGACVRPLNLSVRRRHMTPSAIFLIIAGLVLLGFGSNSLRTGVMTWGSWRVVRRDSFPLQYWIGVSAYLGAGIFLLYEAFRRAD